MNKKENQGNKFVEKERKQMNSQILIKMINFIQLQKFWKVFSFYN